MGSSLILLLSFLLLLNGHGYLNAQELGAKDKVHIVYLGERQHNDTDLITELHHQMLESVLGSNEAAVDSLVHSYKHGFSGFAAKLSESQAQQLAGRDEVISVVPDHLYTVQTTRTWDYLGLSVNAPNNLLHQTNMGDGVIVGVIDSGIWPESKSFNDQGLDPVPRGWKGRCVSGEHFNAKADCNRKLIGAKWFSEGFEAQTGKISGPDSKIREFRSPRDAVGHGTHTAATAAGAFVHNVHYKGLARGVVRGGASRARIAMYKACWGPKGQCSMADLLKAFDEAMHDGVDLLSISLGSSVPLSSEVDFRDISAFASFYAVARGIPVICAGGNTHLPLAQTVVHTAPWILTVAATTVDRSFPTLITLGNNVTLMGQSLFTGQEIGFSNLVHIENSLCEDLSFNHTPVAGKVVLCFTRHGGAQAVMEAVSAVQEARGAGVIVAKNPTHIWVPPSDECPYILVDYELGHRILFYIRSSGSPMVKIKPSKSLTGRPTATEVAYFSCRGPSSTSPAILKPDIAAPGAGILAASSPLDPMYSNGFSLQSGTSMATPHVSGIVALLKAKHPDWSPAAIKSAIVTTAWKTDPFGEPIFAEGSPQKLADPFDYGGGLVNPEKAAEPGLIYDMGIKDYIHYLCARKYSRGSISLFLGQKTKCQKRLSILDLNLPSITIPSLKSSVTLTRTVTNVGPVDSTYKSIIESPLGTTVKVSPQVLVFNSTVKVISFNVIVSTSHKVNTGYFFGSLTWSDGVHRASSPITVRTKIVESYVDDF